MTYSDFKITVTGTPAACQIAAQGPQGISEPAKIYAWNPPPDVAETLEIVLAGGHSIRHAEAVLAGSTLYNFLFPPPILACFEHARCAIGAQNKLRIVLSIQPPELARLPWEMLYDPHQGFFISTQHKYPLVRLVESREPVSAFHSVKSPAILYVQTQADSMKKRNCSGMKNLNYSIVKNIKTEHNRGHGTTPTAKR